MVLWTKKSFVLVGHVQEDDQRISAARVVSGRKIDVEVSGHSENWRVDAAIDPVIVGVVDDRTRKALIDPLQVGEIQDIEHRAGATSASPIKTAKTGPANLLVKNELL